MEKVPGRFTLRFSIAAAPKKLDSIPFEQLTEILGQIAQRIGDSLERTSPSKACVELGVEFGLENGQLVALIARGSGKANLKVSLEWDRSEPKAGSSG
jgi:hypothetical protein